MGCIRQMQRRAIEELCDVVNDQLSPIKLKPGIAFRAADERSLFPLGVSTGVGTCSDIYGMNVLVLGDEPPRDERLREDIAVQCAYAVLLRLPRDDEWRDRNRPKLCVERLAVATVSEQKIVFSRTGFSKLYHRI